MTNTTIIRFRKTYRYLLIIAAERLIERYQIEMIFYNFKQIYHS